MSRYSGHSSFFHEILTRGSKSNTYKFALARFLLDYSRKLDPEYIGRKLELREQERIPYTVIAKYFLRYYWHQECKFKIIHNFEPQKPPNVIKIIRRVFGTQYIPEYYGDMDRRKVRQAEEDIVCDVFGRGTRAQVVPRFQNIPRVSPSRPFYDYDDEGIALNPDALEVFSENYNCLFRATILEWSRFLEKINTLPRIIAKVESDNMVRRPLTSYKKTFGEFSKCFYCPNTLRSGEVHVDHFIPWSYMFEDESWNLVLACRSCNLKKSDMLASESFLERLIARNDEYKDNIQRLAKSLVELSPEGRWASEMRRHYKNCKGYGFREVVLS